LFTIPNQKHEGWKVAYAWKIVTMSIDNIMDHFESMDKELSIGSNKYKLENGRLTTMIQNAH
jgi:hypothetical protein